MKIKRQHYERLDDAITRFLTLNDGVLESYRKDGLSDKRFRWDVLRSVDIDGKRGITWVCDELYPYLNDDNVDTALRRITGTD